MVLLYPLVLFGAVALVWRGRHRAGGRGWAWFAAWAAAGGLFGFSFVTGFTIGLFVLPVAAAALFLVASRAPHFSAGLGFVAGVGAMLLLVASVNSGRDSAPWLVAGIVAIWTACQAYAFTRRLPEPENRDR